MNRRPALLSLLLATVVAVSFILTAKLSGGQGNGSAGGPAGSSSPSGSATGTPSGSASSSGATGTSPDGSVSLTPAAQTTPFTIAKLAPGEKPPQFVIVGFDGSGDVAQLQDWARLTAQVHGNVTYFLSGVFMLNPSQRMRYHGPQKPTGYSAIGFAKPQDPITDVTSLLSQAWLEGNDIGTHFNGHFCGPNGVQRWSQADWTNELKQFNFLLDHWKSNNGLSTGAPLSFNSSVSVGGRTPCLEGKPAAYLSAMAKLGYRYDTSGTGTLSWPKKTSNRLWEFPLQTIQWKGAGGGNQLAMDYNLWYSYNHATSITSASERAKVSKAVYDSYLAAFNATYAGNRAPLFFGNHMNYWGCDRAYTDCYHGGSLSNPTPLQHYGPFVDGLQRSYLTMCSKPDVQCISYRQMADWLDAQDPAVLAALQAKGEVAG